MTNSPSPSPTRPITAGNTADGSDTVPLPTAKANAELSASGTISSVKRPTSSIETWR